jgi:uncharacterized membrane protein HdeD (DUF308 family)
MLDLRIPSGWFFSLLGVILLTYGLFQPQLRAALTDVNVNLYCGVLMLAFGVFLLALARRGAQRG